ncbi:MAG: pyridoxal 5'-phosphate synthase glutaminase subunit PdxT [Thermomicrobia bacterium]|nr:pyridoxal 5'-phosphate synthase glutaminase subunit PdxT [Thermomicrobia bacterium]
MTTIGVLALQGAFIEHVHVLERLGVAAREVRLPRDLDGLDGLIMPGGESTTIGKLMVQYSLDEPIRTRARAGFPIWGTCAGMILLAKDIGGLRQPLIGVMDIVVERNAFGRQLDSFEADLDIPAIGAAPFRTIFIRAPLVHSVSGATEVLARLADGRIVAAREGNLLATSFHPELTNDDRLHRYFIDEIVTPAQARADDRTAA